MGRARIAVASPARGRHDRGGNAPREGAVAAANESRAKMTQIRTLTDAATLAQPLTLRCGAILPNRIVKAAMSEALATRDLGPSDRLVRLYERWGRSGAGMLLSGNVIVDRDGRTEPANVVLEDDRHLAGLRRWADAAQASGARLWMQISHAGRQVARGVSSRPVAPSAVGVRGGLGLFATPRALEEHEVRRIVERFAHAASLAREAGFGGVEIHGAHGYLVSQFLSPLVNQRDDAYGGDPQRRMAFLLEIVRAMRAGTAADFPIGVKLNSADFQRGGFAPEDAVEVVRALDAAGIDLVEVSGGNYESPAMVGRGEIAAPSRASTIAREAYFLEYAQMLRAHTKAALLLTGGLRSAAAMAEVVRSDAADLVGLGRPMAITPELPRALLDGSITEAPEFSSRIGVRKLDDVLAVIWFQRQMHRMADGNEPDARASKVAALGRAMGSMLFG
jgi:2,4-dienoyl-CoA reductase-like NADH-dependent reductase (Old Yellow Enzyme family)